MRAMSEVWIKCKPAEFGFRRVRLCPSSTLRRFGDRSRGVDFRAVNVTQPHYGQWYVPGTAKRVDQLFLGVLGDAIEGVGPNRVTLVCRGICFLQTHKPHRRKRGSRDGYGARPIAAGVPCQPRSPERTAPTCWPAHLAARNWRSGPARRTVYQADRTGFRDRRGRL
jgi:hypothetical protein